MTLNTDRMRRHIARNTADVVRKTFNLADEDYTWQMSRWQSQFGERMKIKHKGVPGRVQVYIVQPYPETYPLVEVEMEAKLGELVDA